MTLQAFHGDAELKAQMIDRVRSLDAAGTLLTMGVLRWDPAQSLYSINGALAETADRDEFIKRTGIPVELAQIVESTAAMNTISLPNKGRPFGMEFRTEEETRRIAVDWYESIRPGADLSDVLPKFMVFFLEFVLSDEFDQKGYLTPAMASAAQGILANWKIELAGENIDAKAWRAIRAEAVAASEHFDEAWTYPLAHFVESFAWPLNEMTGEFGAAYGFLCGNWLAFTRRPFLDEDQKQNSEFSLKGHLLATRMERDGKGTPEDMNAMLEANPDIKRAMTLNSDPQAYTRYLEGQQRAFAATTPRVRKLLDQLVTLVAAA